MKQYFDNITTQLDNIFIKQFSEAWQVGIKQYERAKTVAYGLFSYHWINNTLDFLWQYHMALAFVTASSFAAATSVIMICGGAAAVLFSLLAPVIHYIWPQSAGKILPSILLIGSIFFFCLILGPRI